MTALTQDAVIGVIGAGTMGAGIAQVAASAGHSILLYDAMGGAAEKGLSLTASGLEKLVARKRIDAEKKDAILNNISVAKALDDLSDCSMVIEAIVEDLAIKQHVFGKLEDICGSNTILASNTSSLSLTAIGSTLKRPENLVGMHFFNPAPVMKLVEVISSLATSPEVAKTVFGTAETWGKKPVSARSTPGFIVNRVARPFYAEALRVLEEGAGDTATLDAIMREAGGFRMGPFELMDLIGHDVNYAVTSSVFDAFYADRRFTPSLIQKELVDAGFLGRKSGRGFYDYSKDAIKLQPHTEKLHATPSSITLNGESSFINSVQRLLDEKGIQYSSMANDRPSIKAGSCKIELCSGKTATQIAAHLKSPNLVLIDLTLNFATATRVCLSRADQCNDQAFREACGFFQALGKQVSVIDDIAGMCITRTVCMLANEGADTVNRGVCSAEAVDIAMLNGVNYPKGPMLWASEIGVGNVVTVLTHLRDYYGEERYRVSPLLQRKATSGTSLL